MHRLRRLAAPAAAAAACQPVTAASRGAALMGWLKLDDGYGDHPKLVAAGWRAELLDLRAMLYCARRETDGFVPRAQLRVVGRDIPAVTSRAQELVAVGRWHDGPSGCCPDPPGDGWQVHDYLRYNPSRGQRDAEREAGRARVAEHRERKRSRRSNGGVTDYSGRSNGGVTAPRTRPRVPSEPSARAGAREGPVENPPGVASSRAFRPLGPVENLGGGQAAESVQPVDNADSVGNPVDNPGARARIRRLLAVPAADLEAS